MFLKSLELRGFKSFAEKTELILKEGITTIVGPNGSGKSNISDGVRWVLGEQSIKSLRGGKMEDVIFAGTQFRKAVGLAQVALTLDNSKKQLPIDYSDVTISRRLFRSGESQYYINNTQCRLKDIQELFMDTGIGKEGYSIIGQGKIDAVLSGKPEERRSLLEEAAGIVKFKTRKEEAQKKLQSTQQNLIRLNDILITLEERLEPLRIESGKAKEFLTLSTELKSSEVNLIIFNIEKIQFNIISNKTNLLKLNEEIKLLNGDLESLKLEAENLSLEQERHEIEHSDHQKRHYKFKEDVQKKEGEINILLERISNLDNSIYKLNTDLKEYLKHIDDNKGKLAFHENELSILLTDKNETDGKIDKLEKVIEGLSTSVADLENLIKKLKEEQIELISSISDITNSVNLLKSKDETLNGKVVQIKNSCEISINLVKTNNLTKSALESEIDKAGSRVTYLQSEIGNKKIEISSINNIISSDEKELKDLANIHSRLEANRNMLINLDKQYEGYNRSVKLLMQDIEKGKINHIKSKCCILGEIISVDKKLETAIEIALGSSISSVITEDESVAKGLIKYLKDNNLGRATFLPLTTVKSKKLSLEKQLSLMKGYLGLASELIEYDEKYSGIMDFVLGRTVVCENMDSALEISRKYSYSFRIVTLGGDVVNPGGSLTGGSLAHKSASIISRKREIDELLQRIKETEVTIHSLTNKIEDNKRNIKSIDSICLNYTDEVYASNIEITKLKERIVSIVNENTKLQQNIDITKNEIEFIINDIKNNTNDIKLKDEELLFSKINLEEHTNRILDIEKSFKENNDKTRNIRDELTSLKINQAKINENVLNKEAELNRLNLETKDYMDKTIKLNSDLFNAKNEKALSNEKVAADKSLIETININLLNSEAAFKEYDIMRLKIKEKVNSNASKINDINGVLSSKESELHKFEIGLARMEAELDSQYLRLNEDYEITYAEALKYKKEISNTEQYKSRIEGLKSSIASLGTVSVGAIEEYKEVKEKYTFMNSQKSDLLKAVDELNGVIDDMISKMKLVFRENFDKLRMYFSETFVELFKGGSADLLLNDGDELDGNIDITVQPPGKKLQNINLMSGGEKGLSAIALLFAILKMKPTPFCILDEIEAALDDANVTRYAEFLKRFSSNTQFIVITHRKGTMEVSDALYGVTMEEKGVSKIISIDLTRQV
jgi:chromosome segregation protein